MKNKIIKICEEYNWTFKGKTSKGVDSRKQSVERTYNYIAYIRRIVQLYDEMGSKKV